MTKQGNLHGIGIGVIALVVIGKEHLQDGMGIAAVVGWILCHIPSQNFALPKKCV